MHNHMNTRARSVVKGIAVDDAWAHTKRLRMKTMEKINPGNIKAV